jgi:hypothetical protein
MRCQDSVAGITEGLYRVGSHVVVLELSRDRSAVLI